MFFNAIGAAWFIIKFLTITALWINAASAHLNSKNNVNLKTYYHELKNNVSKSYFEF